MFDTYDLGEMIWLEADATIREQSGGRKSLDDFARTFFDTSDDGTVTRTYTWEQMLAALLSLQPYDWRAFLHARLDEYGHATLRTASIGPATNSSLAAGRMSPYSRASRSILHTPLACA